MPRNIKNLNRRELHKLYNCDISEYVFNYAEVPTEEERQIAEKIEHELDILFKHFPRVLYPEHKHTPDFATAIEYVALEIKNTKSIKNGINNAFKRANRQFKELKPGLIRIVYINICTQDDTKNDDIVEEVASRAFAHNISFYIVDKNYENICARLP